MSISIWTFVIKLHYHRANRRNEWKFVRCSYIRLCHLNIAHGCWRVAGTAAAAIVVIRSRWQNELNEQNYYTCTWISYFHRYSHMCVCFLRLPFFFFSFVAPTYTLLFSVIAWWRHTSMMSIGGRSHEHSILPYNTP